MPNGENARLGYEIAVTLFTSQAADTWSRFNAMLVANSLLLAAIGFVFTEELRYPVPPGILTVTGSVIGWLLCFFWFLLIRRPDRYQEYWIAAARELEAQLAPINILTRGRQFGEGVQIQVNGQKMQMGPLARRRSVRWMYAVIIIFVVLYLLVSLVPVFAGQSGVPSGLAIERRERVAVLSVEEDGSQVVSFVDSHGKQRVTVTARRTGVHEVQIKGQDLKTEATLTINTTGPAQLSILKDGKVIWKGP